MRCTIMLWRIGSVAALPVQLANFTLWPDASLGAVGSAKALPRVCLRLPTEPIGIGVPSQTFLEWYGSESACSRGHGLLSHFRDAGQLLRGAGVAWLDDSWNGLFSPAAEVRQR